MNHTTGRLDLVALAFSLRYARPRVGVDLARRRGEMAPLIDDLQVAAMRRALATRLGCRRNYCSFRSATRRTDGARKEPLMALKPGRTQNARTVGHVSHDAQARIDKRVAKILAAREAALRLARGAARRSERV
jgi:hypothetical protein